MAISGQLWYGTVGTGDDSRIVHVNGESGLPITVVDDDPNTPLRVETYDVAVDTAIGFYFALTNEGGGANPRLLRGAIGGGAPIEVVNFTTLAVSVPADPSVLVAAMHVDTVGRRIFVGSQEGSGNGAQSGIRMFTYDAAGTVSGGSFIVTQSTSNKGLEGGLGLFLTTDLDYDPVANRLYFVESFSGGASAQGLFSLSLSAPTVITQVVSQAQFPDNGTLGQIRDVEVDAIRGNVFFTTRSDQGLSQPAENAIWRVATGASGATAVKVTLDVVPTNFYPDDLAFDQVLNQLYVESNGTSTVADTISVYQLNAAGTTGTLIRTISPGLAVAGTDVGGMIFAQLPTLTATASAAPLLEGQVSAVFNGTPTLTDAEGYLTSATVTITTGLTPGDTLSLVGSPISGSYDAGTGILTLTGVFTVAQYQAALAGLRYSTTNDNPTAATASRTITIVLKDGTPDIPANSVNTSTTTFTVQAVNDAPVNTVPGAKTVLEDSVGNNGATPVNAITGLSIADPDAGTGTVRVTLSVASGVLNIRTDSSGINASEVTGNGTATLVITATIAKINATFAATGAGGANGLTYTSTANFNGTDTLTIVTNDLGLNGTDPGNTGNSTSEADTDTVTINVTSVNDAPAGTDKTLTVIEDTPRTFTAADFGFTDIDGNALQGVVITTVPTTGTLKFGSTAAPAGLFVAAIDIGSLSFEPAANANGAAYASFTFQVQDDGGNAVNGVNRDQSPNTITFDVTAVNDAPLFAAAGAQPSFTENGAALAIATNVTLTDVDNANFNGGSLTLSFSNLIDGDGVGIDTNGTGITLSGATVLYNNVAIGTITTANTTALAFAFNTAAATPAAVIALTQATVFQSISDNPTAAQRTVVYTLIDGGGGAGTASFTRTISVIPVDDAPVAQPDAFTIGETGTITAGNLFASNGSGIDADIDGPALTIAAVNAAAGSVNAPITLASGALLTVNANGTFSYNPNGKFDYLVASGSGTGAQSVATDSFTYTLTGGNTVTATITITGVTGAGDQLRGAAGADTITGTTGADYIDIRQGGADIVNAGDGNDTIFTGAGFSADDQINGGLGTDQITLRGSYTGSLGNVTGTEFLGFLSGTSTRFGGDGSARYSYDVTTTNATVAPGVEYIVQANELVAGENLRFDGSAETDGGSFRIYAGKGIDSFIGGTGDDGFLFGEDGRFTAADQINGGGGSDQIGLRGNYSVTLIATTVINVETIVLLSAFDAPAGAAEAGAYAYALVLDEATVAATRTLTINAAQLRGTESANVNGSAETNGKFTFIGGLGADVFVGGSGADTLYGGLGVDTLTGGDGDDIFMYRAVADSGPALAARDTITDFKTGDRIDLSVIDAVTGGGDDAFSFAAAFTNTPGQLRVTLVSLGNYLVEGDVDGIGGADFAINVKSDHALVAADFIL